MFGQSNMAGAGTIESQDRTVVDERVQVMGAVTCTGNNTSFTLGKWKTLLHPSFVAGRALELVITSGEAVEGCDIVLFDKENYATYAANAPEWMKGAINDYGG